MGATGYSGGELIRLLLNHASVQIQHVTSESSAGKRVSEVHSDLLGRLSLRFEKFIGQNSQRFRSGLCLFSSNSGIKVGGQLVKSGVRVIDLSADYRLSSPSLYKTWYKKSHTAKDLLRKRAYGLPELFKRKSVVLLWWPTRDVMPQPPSYPQPRF